MKRWQGGRIIQRTLARRWRWSFVRARLGPVTVAVWCVVLFVYGLDAGPLYRTEALRAIIGRECLNGQWLYPVLYGEPFLTKPPGHYVAIGVCSLPWGEVSPASARLPSVVAATVAVVLMHRLFRRALGERAALLVALLLPCSVLWLDKVPSAEIDMTLVGWVTAAIVLFYQALDTNSPATAATVHGPLLVLSLLCVAAGTLTKWTAPAFFYLTVIPLLLWRGQLALLASRKHLVALAVATGLCGLWALAVIQQVGWPTLAETVQKEAAYRFAPKASQGYPWWEVVKYPVTVVAAHLPVSAFALLTFRRTFWNQYDDRAKLLLQLLHCWTWPSLLFWTLVPNHNVRYALPLSPGLMGLGVFGLYSIGSAAHTTVVRRLVIAFIFSWFIIKVIFVEGVMPQRTAGRNAQPTAAQLREQVPADQPLYTIKLKDEGITFYYAREVRKLTSPSALPSGGFALLIQQEWDNRTAWGAVALLDCMYDQQGDPIYLVRKP
ncbi:MAG: glycosyltransferase family 39 protein [Gemmataceae bacterium]|nr:glycosyltransferase family 39 protein [Gemmata sp.]MDW8197671.1 glycosyltransferase family 39 protein [Gemmataceae bacterium]